jgi:hypothetical protein
MAQRLYLIEEKETINFFETCDQPFRLTASV